MSKKQHAHIDRKEIATRFWVSTSLVFVDYDLGSVVPLISMGFAYRVSVALAVNVWKEDLGFA